MLRFLVTAALFVVTFPVLAQEAPLVRGQVELGVELDGRPPAQVSGDVLALPVFAGEDLLATALRGADAKLAAAVKTAAAQGLLPAKPFDVLLLPAPSGLAAGTLLFVGAGEEKALDAERLRQLAGTASRHLRERKVSTLAFHVRGSVPPAEAAAAATEGAALGLFDAGFHKSDGKPIALRTLRLSGVSESPLVRAAVDRALVKAQAVNMARSLTVEPANYMTPEILAAHARAVARDGNLELSVFDEARIQELGMGGVWAVGKGSANPPRFIVLRYRAARPTQVTLALVGKGVCFDSGGITLKEGEGMYRMKGDMAGGAAVLAALQIVARLKPDVNVIGVVPAVENLPDGRAQKPGDVFVGLSGKTVEVLSTDAEGRMILADGLAYAVSQGATHLVDVATLTGTVVRALGDRHVGAFASDDALFEALQAAARRTGESFWRLPLDDEYAREITKSLVADLNETGGDAGASVGAKFIQQFTSGKPWIHLDIAGLSWPSHTPPWRAAGPTGVSARTLAELAFVLGERQ